MIYFTSDTFFGRSSIIKVASRPFATAKEMNSVLIENWNKVVTDDDIVYHLGNFAWSPIVADEVLNKVNGQIKFIIGDHDQSIIETVKVHENVEILPDQIHILPENRIVLSHWPLADWPGKTQNVFHLHGHTKDLKTDIKVMNRINMCTDLWKFTPRSIEELADFFPGIKS